MTRHKKKKGWKHTTKADRRKRQHVISLHKDPVGEKYSLTSEILLPKGNRQDSTNIEYDEYVENRVECKDFIQEQDSQIHQNVAHTEIINYNPECKIHDQTELPKFDDAFQETIGQKFTVEENIQNEECNGANRNIEIDEYFENRIEITETFEGKHINDVLAYEPVVEKSEFHANEQGHENLQSEEHNTSDQSICKESMEPLTNIKVKWKSRKEEGGKILQPKSLKALAFGAKDSYKLRCIDEMKVKARSVINNLEDQDVADFMVLLQLVAEKRLSSSNIAFQMLLDTAKHLSLPNSSMMVYRDELVKFYRVILLLGNERVLTC